MRTVLAPVAAASAIAVGLTEATLTPGSAAWAPAAGRARAASAATRKRILGSRMGRGTGLGVHGHASARPLVSQIGVPRVLLNAIRHLPDGFGHVAGPSCSS